MEIYLVEAVDNTGKKVKKILETEDELQLISILEYTGMTPIKIKKLPLYFKYLNFRKLFYRIKTQEVIEILENLHLIVKSGMPLNTALIDLAEDSDNPAIKDMLADISFKIRAGQTLSDVLENYKNIFSEVVVSLIKIGEETGNLDKTLKDAAEHLKRLVDLKSKTKQALIYPAFAFFSTLGAMIFWFIFVLPKIIKAFKGFGIELPATTKMLIWMSDFVRHYILLAIFITVFGIIFTNILRAKNTKFRYHFDKLVLKLPILGIIIINFNYAFFAEYVRLMITSGLPLYQSLQIMEKAMKNFVFKTSIKNVYDLITIGKPFSESLKEQKLFSPLIIRMISIGEQTGKLDEQLNYISKYYYEKVDYISQNIAKMIEPIVIGIIGGFMLIIMLGLIGPIYELINSVAKF
jgi:type II secretory pathway component PulF